MAVTNVIAFPAVSTETPLRRPATLIRAARAGQAGWNRNRDLAALLRRDDCPAAGQALPRLRAQETVQNNLRLAKASDYDMRRHVLLMIAIMAEMRAVTDQSSPRMTERRQQIDLAAMTAASVREKAIPARL